MKDAPEFIDYIENLVLPVPVREVNANMCRPFMRVFREINMRQSFFHSLMNFIIFELNVLYWSHSISGSRNLTHEASFILTSGNIVSLRTTTKFTEYIVEVSNDDKSSEVLSNINHSV